MILLISRLNRKTRLTARVTSTAGPSPLASSKVFSGTRNVSIMVLGIVAKPNSQCLRRELPGTYNTARAFVEFQATSDSIEELPQQSPRCFGLLPRRVMPSFRKHSQLTARNVPMHQFRFVRSSQGVFVSGQEQCRYINSLQCIHRVRTLGHATLYGGNIGGRHFLHPLQRARHQTPAGLASPFT